ncbi:ABC transporter substrate-binding protein [Marinibactrum halimedae]|uniref:Leucine-binding protein domain-containing protein n=1 Tax=Marinibactrum halimedae TaxID=1444977 RepID=A0AA37T2H7_9GAMM|nr:ABC transporter substrate-binding protein [Marinibactrum halimedae]MCD9459877.1 ABC transporter substrate-binding protein [Marinibactrum halimedae]GLS25268.1 hypothetical protein GCM10007877_09820 [Marinibactrum halimedae]
MKCRVGLRKVSLFVFLCIYSSLFASKATSSVIKIYLDADRTRHFASARSIEMGVKTAFAEVNNTIQGRRVEFVMTDHRANSSRSKLNMQRAFSDPDTLLVIGGMHSPPLIKNRAFINERKMLTLVPWAAGGPITRYPSEDNWIFRLSIDDTKAGFVIAEYAVKKRQCENPHLILEQTPWGESNRKTMSKALLASLQKEPAVTWFNWGISDANFRIKLRSILASKADCLLFVGNSNDGETLAKAILSIEEARVLPVLSHWGITGGSFHKAITAKQRASMDLTFIQTCFSFVSSAQTELSRNVFASAQTMFSDITTATSLKAPAGFIHAYDLSRLLIQGLSQITLTESMDTNRAALKEALEQLQQPVQGLVKRYDKPFSTYRVENEDAHEALSVDDFCMAKFGEKNEILLMD